MAGRFRRTIGSSSVIHPPEGVVETGPFLYPSREGRSKAWVLLSREHLRRSHSASRGIARFPELFRGKQPSSPALQSA